MAEKHTPAGADRGQRQEHPFDPVYDANSRTLILGSFPSVRSREEGFYYGHPRNRFWPLLARCFGEPLPQTVAEKRQLLLGHHIALWDVLASCDITGSSDSSIRSAVPNDLARILDHAPIEKVLCNGATAGKLCRQYSREMLPAEPVVLPSTSPANASWSLDRLGERWGPYLG